MRITDFSIIEEIKSEYVKYRRNGCTREAAVIQLQHSYQDELSYGANDDGILFWIGLADAQYYYKELSSEIAVRALSAIDSIEQLNLKVALGDLKRRKERYSTAPMPERKCIGQSRKYRCTWNIGDTFAYQLSGADAESCGLSGRYILLRKVDELEFSDGRLLPIVTFTLWDDQPLPYDAIGFQRLPMLKLTCGRFGLPKALFEYRIELTFTSKKKLDALPLIFLGNFQNVVMPSDEVVIPNAGLVLMAPPEQLDWICCVYWKWHSSHALHQ